MNPKVDAYLERTSRWRPELEKMRAIALACGLVEDFKWGHPCYTLDGKNVVLMHGFKDYCAYLFFKGVLLRDPKRILIQQTENVQSARQIRFTGVAEIGRLAPSLKGYIKEAIELEKAGVKVALKKTADFKIPEELNTKFNAIRGLKKAFEALTPGRQRAYIFYFSAAKQSKTRLSRIEKYVAQILTGKGLDD